MPSNFKPSTLTFRVAALFASAGITTLIFGSQLGLADLYASEPGAALVAERVAPRADKADCALPVYSGT